MIYILNSSLITAREVGMKLGNKFSTQDYIVIKMEPSRTLHNVYIAEVTLSRKIPPFNPCVVSPDRFLGRSILIE
jgi:hypothetical protein